MTQTFIIIVETKANTQRYTNYIKSYPGWAIITKNSFAVTSDGTATQIRDKLLDIKDPEDRIFVIKSGVAAAWINTIASNDWLRKNL